MASFLTANATLHEENTILRNAAIPTPCHDIPTVPRSPAQSESTDNFSIPPQRDRSPTNNPQSVRSLSPPRRSLDPALLVLDDMSSSLFVPAILNHNALSHFALPKFRMYDGLQDPFDHLMHFRQIMTLQTGNDVLLCKVFPSSLARPALSWLHRLASNTMTYFRYLSKKFVTQYMCSIRRKHSITNLFHIRMGRSKSIMDFMKHFGVAILQLDTVIPNTVLQSIKLVIRPNTQFFDSLSLHPLTSINELFKRGNQYDMLKDEVSVTTKQTITNTSDVGCYNRGKGERSRDDKNQRGDQDSKDSRRFS